jgi:predicted transposase YdaD
VKEGRKEGRKVGRKEGRKEGRKDNVAEKPKGVCAMELEEIYGINCKVGLCFNKL